MSSRFFVDIAIAIATLLIMFPMLRSGNGTLAWSSRLRLLFHCVMPFLILGFFNAKKTVNVKYVYIAAGVFVLFLLYDTGTFVHYINYSINVIQNSDMALGMDMNHAVNLVHLIGNLAYMLLLVFQAYTLNKKRMIT